MKTDSWGRAEPALVFGHRGGSHLAPENTLAAFDRGVSEGVDGLELDVHLSADGDVVVCHDPRVDRTTGAQGAIAQFTARELAAMDAGYRFSPDGVSYPFRGRGVGIPTLREVVDRYPGRRLIVELKDDDRRLAEAAVAVIRRANAGGRVCFGSFRVRVLQAARSADPTVATGAAQEEVRSALYRSWIGLFPRVVPYCALQVPERAGRFRVVSPRLVRAAHRAGVGVQVWVVNDPADMRRLLGWGVDGLITDRPDVAVRVLRDFRR